MTSSFTHLSVRNSIRLRYEVSLSLGIPIFRGKYCPQPLDTLITNCPTVRHEWLDNVVEKLTDKLYRRVERQMCAVFGMKYLKICEMKYRLQS